MYLKIELGLVRRLRKTTTYKLTNKKELNNLPTLHSSSLSCP